MPADMKDKLPAILIYTPYVNDEAVERGMFFAKEGYASWEFHENSIEYLRVSKEVFSYPPNGEEIDLKKLKLVPMTPKEWKDEYIEVDDIF